MSNYLIRPLKTLEELQAVEALQRLVWDDPTTVIYRHMLISLARNGGSILGALQGDQLIGFIISYLGLEAPESERPAMANLKLVSQRMAVRPEYRGMGVGYELKLAQRNLAIELGIRLITWTFDPLLSRNAHLNIRKLGAIGQVYYRDYYGSDASALVKLHSSDRLLAEWWVTSNRVEQRINGRRASLTLQQYLEGNANILNPTTVNTQGLPVPAKHTEQLHSTLALVEIPTDYDAILSCDLDLAYAWRAHSREVLEQLLNDGYAVTDFIHGTYEGRERSFYVLSYGEYSEVRISRFSTN
ncbi:MAG: GNAT family N-acetyltransferase [Aggregatilineales bacterium]